MYIKKLYLQHFGKYHKREIELQKGINLIYGPNEAGKTTIKDFIVGMFYGLERQRGLAARTDEYTRREPLDGGGYAGTMEIQAEEKSWLIDRSFRKEQKTVQVYQQDTGRQLHLEETQSLQGTLVDMDKNAYINTLCISSQGAAYKQELQEEFRQYLMNVNETHTGNLNIKDAYACLNQQKKALNRKGLDNELQTVGRKMTGLQLEKELEAIAAQRTALEQKLVEAEQSQKASPKKPAFSLSEEEKKQLDPQLKQIMNMVKVLLSFGIFALVLLLIFLLPISMYYKCWLVVIAIAVALYLWIMLRMRKKKKAADSDKEKKPSSGRGASVGKGNQEKSRQDADRILEYSRQLADLQVQENDILKENALQQDLISHYDEIKRKIAEADIELEAIQLAEETIRELSGSIYNQYGPGISQSVSAMVSRITQGQYTDVRLDEQLHIQVRKEGRYIGAEFLSTGTLEQIYLAVRLAVAAQMSQSGMPLMLDDIFGAYDDARLEAVLKCLAEYPAEQVILFTAGDRLADILDCTDIDYNYVEI